MDQLEDDEYECFTCKRRFRSALFSISRERSRVHYDEGEPEFEISGSTGLECYCSEACATSRRSLVMETEGVPISHPGIGSIESCSRCGAPVDMAEFHVTYLESYEVHRNANTLDTVSLHYLAVLCRKCQPLRSDRDHATDTAEIETTVSGAKQDASYARVAVPLGATLALRAIHSLREAHTRHHSG